MNVALHLFIPPIGEFDTGGVDDATPLVDVGSAVYVVGDGDRLVAIKGTMLAVGGAGKIGEFGNGAAGISRQVVIVFCGKHGVTSLSDK